MKRILIVDDDSAVRASLTRLLGPCGYSLTLAADGQQAQDYLRREPQELIILDLEMPVRDGWDVLDDLQSIDPEMPVIVLTGKMDQLDSFELYAVDALLGKPVDAERLLASIERLLVTGSKRKGTSPHRVRLGCEAETAGFTRQPIDPRCV